MDLIAAAGFMPNLGHSVTATDFAMAPGGKAANQACQLAQEGCNVGILTRLGNDVFGQQLEQALIGRSIDVSLVSHDAVNPTGASTIFTVGGEYASIIAPGAAARLTREDIDRHLARIQMAQALVLQLEVPVQLSLHAARIAAGARVRVILNASPLPDDPASIAGLLELTDMLVVNRAEARGLLGDADITAPDAAADLAKRYALATVVVTSGAAGSDAFAGGLAVHQPAMRMNVVDTIGAGDAFLGTLVAALLRSHDLPSAMRRAAAAAALTVSSKGGFHAVPARQDIDNFLARI